MQRGVVEFVNRNRLVAGLVALAVVAAAVTFALLGGGKNSESKLTGAGPQATETATPGPTGTGPGTTPVASTTLSAGGRGTGGGLPSGVIPGVGGGKSAAACTPKSDHEVGVTDSTITIGQVVTDSNQLPQQLRPAHEGLQAFVDVVNKAGGFCHRKLVLQYRNDQLNPAIHSSDVRDLGGTSLAFVANESLLDQLDYDQNPPFEPTGTKVPDVGGLAFGYPRSQSRWHAGVVGSVSPTLVGGGEFKYMLGAQPANERCTNGGVIYLNEPTGASQDQATLGAVSLEQSWGGGLGSGHTKLYAANLNDSVPVYEVLVDRMVNTDHRDCIFTYTDLQSSINLVKAMDNRGYWPPSKCKLAACIRVTYIPLSAYDERFVTDSGEGGLDVSTFIPHIPLSETSNPAMRTYIDALKNVSGAHPSTFSVFGFASGLMLLQGLQGCPEAPTRSCLMDALHNMKDFTASGLLGGTTPFRTSRATYSHYGTFDWKWIFNTSVTMRVLDRNGKRGFYRINPGSGFLRDTIEVARSG